VTRAAAPGSRAVFVAVVTRVGGHLVALATGAVSIALITRALPVVTYAHYVNAIVLVTVVGGLVDGGFVTLCVREAAKSGSDRSYLARQAVGFRLLSAAGAAVLSLSFVLISYRGAERADVLLASVILLAVQPMTAFGAAWTVQGESAVRVGRLVLADALGRLAGLGLLVTATETGAGLPGVTGAVAVSALISVGVLAWTHRATGLRAARPAWPQRVLLRRALPLGLALLLNVLYFRVDALLLSLLRPGEELALYGFAYRVLEMILVLGGFVLAALLPVLAGAAGADEPRWTQVADQAFRFFLALGLVVAVVGALVAHDAARLVGGERYAPAGTALAILMLSGALSWVNGFGGLLLISKDAQGRALWLNVTALTVNVVANLMLVPGHGYLAAAWITVFSELVNFVGMVVLVKRLVGYTWRPSGLLVAVALTALAVVVLEASLAVGAPTALAAAAAGASWGVGALRLRVVPGVLLRRGTKGVI
jgi:O-antigen/teichoic acid export membrane protein